MGKGNLMKAPLVEFSCPVSSFFWLFLLGADRPCSDSRNSVPRIRIHNRNKKDWMNSCLKLLTRRENSLLKTPRRRKAPKQILQ